MKPGLRSLCRTAYRHQDEVSHPDDLFMRSVTITYAIFDFKVTYRSVHQTIGVIQSNLVWLTTERIYWRGSNPCAWWSNRNRNRLAKERKFHYLHELFAIQEIHSGGANWCNRALNTCRCNQGIIGKTVNNAPAPWFASKIKVQIHYLPSFLQLIHYSFVTIWIILVSRNERYNLILSQILVLT